MFALSKSVCYFLNIPARTFQCSRLPRSACPRRRCRGRRSTPCPWRRVRPPWWGCGRPGSCHQRGGRARGVGRPSWKSREQVSYSCSSVAHVAKSKGLWFQAPAVHHYPSPRYRSRKQGVGWGFGIPSSPGSSNLPMKGHVCQVSTFGCLVEPIICQIQRDRLTTLGL